jgi:hypothetical protein
MGCYNNGYMSNGGGNTVTVTEHDTSTYTQVSSITGLRKMVYSLGNQDVHRYRNVDRHIQLVSQPSSGLHHFIIFTHNSVQTETDHETDFRTKTKTEVETK